MTNLSRAQRARNSLGGAVRRKDSTPQQVEAARLELRAAVAERYIERLTAEQPPLSPEQRSRLAALLLAPGDGHAGAA